MDDNYIYGRNTITQLLMEENPKLSKVFLSFAASGTAVNKIYTLAKQHKVPISKMDNRKFKELEKRIGCDAGGSQGVIALRELVQTLDDTSLLKKALAKEKYPIIIALDNIEDPHNLGAIARTVECSGASGILISEHNSSPITPTAVKVSTGALEIIDVASVGNLSICLENAKELGFWIIGTDMGADKVYTDNIYDRPVILVIGSEGKGMRPIIRKKCDIVINIPMKGKINSLNASVSAAIILYERLRQVTA